MTANTAAALHRSAIVWDNHACMPLRVEERFLPQLERFRSAGATVVSLNVGFDLLDWPDSIRMLAHFRHWIRRHPGQYRLIETVDDICEAKRAGELGICFDLEGGCALARQLSMIELYRDLGVRWMLMAYNKNNELGGGCLDEDTGLTSLGREMLREMERVGVVACCSHVGYRTAREIIDESAHPVIFSHSNARALHDHPRNIPDELIVACARRGGLIGVTSVQAFLGTVSVDALVAQISYVAQLVGAGHVAVGLDVTFDQEEVIEYVRKRPDLFPNSENAARDLSTTLQPEVLPEITECLLQQGYSESEVCGILGGNLVRIAGEVWKPTLQSTPINRIARRTPAASSAGR